MKKTLIILLMTSPIFASEIYKKEEALQILGYDPSITLIKEKDSSVVNSKRKTVYFHGFGGNKDAASIIKQYYGVERLPGDVITFDFADANNGGMDTSKSSLGQWNDVKTALYVLKKLLDAGETEIGINAHSRGGATAINMVAVLVDQTRQYNAHLSELGIEEDDRVSILAMLQKGHMILECPLINVREVIKHQIEESCSSSSISSWFKSWPSSLSSSSSSMASVSDSLTYSSATSADYVAPILLKKYRPWAEQAIKSVDAWNSAHIPTIVHFQEVDEVLGNAMDETFYAKLKQSNGDNCTYIHKGNDGGHNSSFKSFASTRNQFLRKYNAAYTIRPLSKL
jgi:hypothetical protein